MRTKPFIIVLFLSGAFWPAGVRGQVAAPGIAFGDASTVYNSLFAQNADVQALRNIFTYYCGRKITDYNSLKSALNATGNDYFADYAGRLEGLLGQEAFNPNVAIGVPAGVISPSPGLNATNILEGLSQFLISRGQEELSMAFFTRFQKALVLYPELTYLFPKTCMLIGQIQNYNLLNLLQQLRDLFQKDLLNMPTNILSLRTMVYVDTICKCGTRVEAIKRVMNGAGTAEPIAGVLTIVQGIINGDNIITTLGKTVQDPVICPNTGNISGYLKLSAFLTDALRADQDGDGVFINDSKIRALFNNNDLLHILVGLAYQRYIRMDCYAGDKFSIQLGANTYHLKTVLDEIVKTTGQASITYSDISKINANFLAVKANIKAGTPVNFANYGAMIDGTFSLVETLSKTLGGSQPGNTVSADLVILHTNLRTAVDFCTDVQQRNYSGIFNDIIKVIKDNKILGDEEAYKTVITYLSFGSNLASATSPEQVKSVLEAAALPAGSYSIKQKSAFNISLNGYIGYNWDINKGHGIYAPIGVAFSFGTDKSAGGALTLFGSFLDLGGIAAYQLSNNNGVDTLKQNITFESVISPSVQLFYEIPKWPLAVGAGWRMTPKLFYNGDGALTTVKPQSTFHISVLIDIPIFTLYNRPFK